MQKIISAFLLFTSISHVSAGVGQSWISCLEDFEKHVIVPDTAVSQFWHKLGEQKVFAARCKFLDQDAKNEKIFTFVTQDGFNTVNYPTFELRVPSNLGGMETSKYPRNLMKFNYEDKDYFISEENKVGDDFDLSTKTTSSGNNFVTKYESLLVSKGYSKVVKLQPAADEEGAKSCINYQIKRYLRLIVETSPIFELPSAAEINADMGKAKWLPELKEKYLKKSADIKQEYLNRLNKDLPQCKEVVAPADLEEFVNHRFGARFKSYDSMRSSVHPE